MACSVTRQKKPGKGRPSLAITYKGHFAIPSCVLNHPDFIGLSGKAIKLLIDIGGQFNGRNNGDLSCARNVMRARGWTSNSVLEGALRELLEADLLVQTKTGGRGIGPHLYALTWQPIHECSGKLDLSATGKKPYRVFDDTS